MAISPNAKEAAGKITARWKRPKRLFQVIYTILLVLAIFIIWIGLTGPLFVGSAFNSTPNNISRPYVELLNDTITTNTSILPPKCRSGNESVIHPNITVTCPTNYVFNCTMCVPICGIWHPYGESYFTAYRVITIFIGVVDFISSFIGLIIILKVPGVFKIPLINYLFMFIIAVIYSFFLAAISISGPHNFFCQQRNEDYLIVARDPPVIVSVVGFVMYFAIFSFFLWFLCATVNLLITVFWPQLRITEPGKSRIILFTIEAIISFAVPLLVPSIYLIIFKEYSFVRTPQHPYPLDVIAIVIFNGLPFLFSIAVPLTVIAVTLYKLQMRKLIVMESRNHIKLNGFEVRLIIFAICLGVLASVLFTEASYEYILKKKFDFKLEEFWSCLTVQNNLKIFRVPNDICPTEYRAYSSPIFTYIRYFAFSSWAILLIVTLTTKETLNAWKKAFSKVLTKAIKKREVIVLRNT